MNEGRIRGLMGLCVRDGAAVFGEDGCRKELTGGKSGALLLDGGASEGTRKRYTDWCRSAGVPLILLREGLLEEATGKPGKAMAIRKGGFAVAIKRESEATAGEGTAP